MGSAPDRLRQLAFPFAPPAHFSAADFLSAPSTEAAEAWLARISDWPHRRLALFGPEGSGKTHLLHIWADRAGARLLPGPGLRFDGLELTAHGAPVAIDDADAAPERALLHVLNAAAEAGLPVLLAAREPPARWPTALPDLASRLRAAAAIGIGAADDALLRALLARLLAERQFPVPEPVQDWLRLRLPRTASAIREAACRLDRRSLAAGRPVTRALAAAVLAEMQEHSGPEDEHPDHADPGRLETAIPATPGGSELWRGLDLAEDGGTAGPCPRQHPREPSSSHEVFTQ